MGSGWASVLNTHSSSGSTESSENSKYRYWNQNWLIPCLMGAWRHFQVNIHLERLGEEEALLDVVLLRLLLVDVAQATVSVRCAAVLLQGEDRLPAPVAVLLVVREAPQHKVALKGLRPQDVVLLLRSQCSRLHGLAESTWSWCELVYHYANLGLC